MLDQDEIRLTAALKRTVSNKNGAVRAKERHSDIENQWMEQAQRKADTWKMW